jgi:hypothetical protein
LLEHPGNITMEEPIAPFPAACRSAIAAVEPVRLKVDMAKPDGTWNMPALALGQGGLQADAMVGPHAKEIRQLRPRTIRLFLSEFYRVYPDHDRYDWTRLDRELRAVRATGARPTLALAMKPPVLYPKVDHFAVHPSDYDEWERLCEALARHCRDEDFQVAAWEVCNEPDIGETGGTPHFFRSAADYNQFYTRTVAGLLRGDPLAQVGGPAVADPDSFLVEGLIRHCAANRVPLHFLSWHLYSDSAEAHAANIAKQRARLAEHPQLQHVRLFVSEWNMDLMRPNLAPGSTSDSELAGRHRQSCARRGGGLCQRRLDAEGPGHSRLPGAVAGGLGRRAHGGQGRHRRVDVTHGHRRRRRRADHPDPLPADRAPRLPRR